MTQKFIALIFFNLCILNSHSQEQLAFLKNCKKIEVNEFIKLKKERPDINISYVFPDGKPFTKKHYDSIKGLSEKNNIKQHFYQDTVSNAIILVHKILSDKEIKQREEDFNQKIKDDKLLRKKLNGSTIDNLVLTDINNNTHTLESLKGKVIVLNFWFIQCKPCVAEFPDLNALKAEFKNKPVEFFAVTFNDKKALHTFFESHELDYHIIPNGRAVIDKFKVPHYPYNVIIDKNGKIEYINDVLTLNVFKKLKRKIKKML